MQNLFILIVAIKSTKKKALITIRMRDLVNIKEKVMVWDIKCLRFKPIAAIILFQFIVSYFRAIQTNTQFLKRYLNIFLH